jgi:hypothetical protein
MAASFGVQACAEVERCAAPFRDEKFEGMRNGLLSMMRQVLETALK